MSYAGVNSSHAKHYLTAHVLHIVFILLRALASNNK